jgi:hypothetical protein
MNKHEFTANINYFYTFASSDYLDSETNFYILENDYSQAYNELEHIYITRVLRSLCPYYNDCITPEEVYSLCNRLNELEQEFNSIFNFVESKTTKIYYDLIGDYYESDDYFTVGSECFCNFRFSYDPEKNIIMGNAYIREAELRQEYEEYWPRYANWVEDSCCPDYDDYVSIEEVNSWRDRMREIEDELRHLLDDTGITKDEYEEAKKNLH